MSLCIKKIQLVTLSPISIWIRAIAFAALFVIAAMGILMYLLTAVIEKKTTRWSVRGLEIVAG